MQETHTLTSLGESKDGTQENQVGRDQDDVEHEPELLVRCTSGDFGTGKPGLARSVDGTAKDGQEGRE